MKTIANTAMLTTPEYRQFIEDLKARFTAARISAARAVNRDLILLYWDIGRAIVEKQQTLGWGESVVEMVSADLRQAFPGMSGFLPRNVWYMRRFYEAYTNSEFLAQAAGKIERGRRNQNLRQAVADLPGKAKAGEDAGALAEFLPQVVAEIPWGHHRLILDKLTDPAGRLYYLRATARFGWSRNVLLNQVKAGAYERAVKEKKTHNFPLALPVYRLQSKLPSELKGKLPTAQQLSEAVRAALPERNGK
jgi:predicted nuclease of restriction endonuclease-like (RecB) superfamily